MYSIRSKNVFINIVVPVSTPGFEIDVVYQMFIHLGNDGKVTYDLDLIDFENLKFMGVEISHKDVRKFFDSQKSMGVDIEANILSIAESEICNEELQKIADEYLDFLKE